jgi:RNA polymerase sigma-70 factor, ECF subfamily
MYRRLRNMSHVRTLDRAAVEELFTACHGGLTGWVGRLVGDDELAADIAAEAFARLLGRWPGLDSPRSYLYVIAANLVNDHWRKASRERHAVSLMATAARGGASIRHAAYEVDLKALIDALPQRLRTAFLLHYCAGCTIGEVAVMLGRPSAAGARPQHGRRHLNRHGVAGLPAVASSPARHQSWPRAGIRTGFARALPDNRDACPRATGAA